MAVKVVTAVAKVNLQAHKLDTLDHSPQVQEDLGITVDLTREKTIEILETEIAIINATVKPTTPVAAVVVAAVVAHLPDAAEQVLLA